MKTPPRRLLLPLGLAAGALLLWGTFVVYPFRLFVVFLHEISHGLAAVATGGRIVSIGLSVDEGGVCLTRGGWPFLILNAGYLGSLLWGAGFLLLGGRRNIFHQDIQTIIAELAGMVQPTLVVLDGTSTMMTNGPTGGSLADLKETRTLIVGTDQVAVDAFGATLLGKTAADLPFIAKAEALGAGSADYRSLSPVEVSA